MSIYNSIELIENRYIQLNEDGFTVILKPSRIIIKNTDIEKVKRVFSQLSVYDNNKWSYSFIREINGDVVIPIGFSLDELVKLIPIKEIYNHMNITSKITYNTNTKFLAEYKCEEQKEINAFLHRYLNMNKYVCSGTGSGKTFSAIKYAIESKKKPIVVTDMKPLVDNWKYEFKKFVNINSDDEIYIIQGVDSVDRLLNMPLKDIKKIKVFITLIQTLKAVIRRDINLLDKLFNRIGVGIKIFDEAHQSCESIFDVDALTDVSETIYLTATPKRSNYLENIVFNRVNDKIVKYFTKEVNKVSKYIDTFVIKFNSKPSGKDTASINKFNRFNLATYSDFIYKNRYDEFFNYIRRLVELTDGKTMIVFQKNDMLDRVYNDLETYLKENNLTYSKYNSTVKDKETAASKDVIFATLKSIEKGIDIKDNPLQNMIITCPIGSEVVLKQVMGRLRYYENYNFKYLELFDNSLIGLNYMYKKRMTVFKKESKSISEIDGNILMEN